MHLKNNPFHIFAMKVMETNSRRTVGHIPIENSLDTRFLLDCGARIIAKVTSCNCYVFSLVQGGLWIPRWVEIYMASTLKNKHLINIYTNHVDLLYYKQEKSSTVGILLDGEVNALSVSSSRIRDGKSKEKKIKQYLF